MLPAHPAIPSGDPTRAPYAIDDRGELVAWLRLLQQRAIVVSLADTEGSAISTTIRAVDTDRGQLTFEAPERGAELLGLMAATELSAIASVEEVKVQFDVHGATLVRGEGWSVIEAPLPDRIYRLQRRETFRMRALPGTTAVEFRHPAWPEMRLALRVLDLSVQGCALLLPDDVPTIDAGVEIGGASLRLDALTRLDIRLRVLHLTSIRPGAAGVRIGCALEGLSPQIAHALQRWIDRLQRRHRPFGG